MTAGAGAAAGYRSAAYAAALGLSGFGAARPLGATGGHVLARAIPGSDRHDLAGPYPLFSCADWEALVPALAGLAAGDPGPDHPVTLVLVADPFCPLAPDALAAAFDLCRALHDHWLIDLAAPLAPSRHHRRKLRQAGQVRIEAGPVAGPDSGPDPGLAGAWVRLYRTLAEKKRITDLRGFSPDSLTAQLAVPGAHLVTARDAAGELIGADLYYLDGSPEGGVAYAHLSAYAPEGYARSVSYPMIAAAAEYFAPRARFIDLGGAPMAETGATGGGVAHFKRGWTALSRPSHLCGRILDPAGYAALTGARDTAYFPAYRAGDFAPRP